MRVADPVDGGKMPVIVFYPTGTDGQAVIGNYLLAAARDAAPRPARHPLVIMSHGSGGTRLGHHDSLAALAAAAPARADNATLPGWQARRLYLEQQDEARYRVCDAQRADNPATRTLDFTPAGRRCLIDALGQAASVQGTLVLLRNASATLRKGPEDPTLRTAALRAVARARVQLASDLMNLRERFREEAAALDLAEFSIHLPQLHYEQQQWRLEVYMTSGPMAR